MADPWDFWRRALGGETGMDIHVSQPQSGFWRMFRRDRDDPKIKHGLPVAIWIDDTTGEFACVEGIGAERRLGGHDRAVAIWPWCVGEPISEELYRAVAEQGAVWPDQDPTVHEQINPRARIGGNNPPEPISEGAVAEQINPPADPVELLREQIEAAAAGVKRYESIADDETEAKAQSLRARLNELAADGEKTMDALKRPHLDRAKAINDAWMPLIKAGREAARRIAQAIAAWGDEKDRRAAEEHRKAEDERLRLEREARERDATLAATTPEPQPEPPPPVAPTQIKGAYGRAASSKPVRTVTAVTDWPALFVFFKDHQDLKDLLMKKAQRAAADGTDVPGCTIEMKRKVA